jgi:glycosyltransferase involved in cell wall biosynthesis
VTFEIAGKPSNTEDPYSRDLLARAASLPNVILHGMVPRDQMSNLYRGASVLCCTSRYEGFPNTFLEAWSYGLPIVSTFEPDDLLSKRKLGILVENGVEMISCIKALMQSPKKWQEMSENAKKYYQENHTLDRSMSKFEDLFLNVRGGAN